MEQKNTNSLVGSAGLITSIIALLVAVGAYNKTGDSLQSEIAQTTDKAQEQLNRSITDVTDEQDNVNQNSMRILSNVNNELESVQQQLANNNVSNATLAQIQSIRTNLANEMNNLDEEGRDFYGQVIRDLESLENQIRAGSDQAQSNLSNIMDDINEYLST